MVCKKRSCVLRWPRAAFHLFTHLAGRSLQFLGLRMKEIPHAQRYSLAEQENLRGVIRFPGGHHFFLEVPA